MLGLHAGFYRLAVSAQRSRGPLGWACGSDWWDWYKASFSPFATQQQQQAQKTLLSAQGKRLTRTRSRVWTLHSSDAAWLAPFLFLVGQSLSWKQLRQSCSPVAHLAIRVQEPQSHSQPEDEDSHFPTGPKCSLKLESISSSENGSPTRVDPRQTVCVCVCA